MRHKCSTPAHFRAQHRECETCRWALVADLGEHEIVAAAPVAAGAGVAAHAQIVAGPGALGIYTIRIQAGDNTVAMQRLREATAVVESVSPLPR